MYYDRVQLKESVKAAMRNTRTKPMLVTLLFSVVVSAGSWFVNTVLGHLLTGGVGVGTFTERYMELLQRGFEVEEALEYALMELMGRGSSVMFAAVAGGAVVSVILYLWQSVMTVGFEGYCLSMTRGENPDVGRVFCAFPCIGGVLVTRILTGIYVFLWSLLLGVGLAVVLLLAVVVAVAADMVVLPMLLIIVGLVVYEVGLVWVTLRYALVDYLVLDQNLSGGAAIQESKRLMQGNIGKAFVLDLSFLGWELLEAGLLTVGFAAAVVPIMMQVAYSGTSNIGGLIATAGFGLIIMMATFIGALVISLWLRSYQTGAMARFYDWAKGASGGPVGPAGWGKSQPPQQDYHYTWNQGPNSGTGIGPGPQGGGRTPPPPKDDPWN